MSGNGDATERPAEGDATPAPDISQIAGHAAERLMSTPDWTKAMDQVLEAMGRATGADGAALLQRQSGNGNGTRLTCLHRWQDARNAGPLDLAAPHIPVPDHGLAGWMERLRTGRPIVGSPGDFGDGEREFMERYRLRSLAAVPVHVDGDWWGVLCLVERGGERTWQPGELDQLTRVAELVARAVERQRRLDEVRMECERAKAATVHKSTFLATMSHEIRDPISGVLGMLRLLCRTPLSAQQRRYINAAITSADGLLEVINDVLDFSKIEAGKLQIQRTEFRPADLLSELRGVFEERVKRKGLGFVVAMAEGAPSTLRGDAVRLRQVLVNLLSNAVKFTDAGGLVVRCQPVGEEGETIRLRFEVKDTGIGMSPEQCAEVFDSFAQANLTISRERGGTGLGLAISKQLVELLGGAIGVESREDVGSTFWFEVPLERAEREVPPAPKVAYIEREDTVLRREKVRVLLAEDNVVNQEVALEMMHQAGYACDCVDNGADAVEAVFSRTYDLVIMDCQMPVMDGYEATRRIREREARASVAGEAARHVLIVALTAHALTGDRERCLQAGMDDYLAKPLEPEQLIGAVDHWLSRRTWPLLTESTSLRERPGERGRDPASRELDIERFLKRCMGNRQLAGRLLVKFEEQTESDLRAIRDGMRAGDIAAMRAAAHRLKGAAANLSAEPVRACAAALYSTSAGAGPNELEARIVTLEEAVVRLRSSITDLKAGLGSSG